MHRVIAVTKERQTLAPDAAANSKLTELKSAVIKCQRRLAIYRAHLIADMHQSKFRGKILQRLQQEWWHVYGIHDYWQKVLAAKHKEAASYHFGKRGISVHGSVWFIPIPPQGAEVDGHLIDRSRFSQVESGFASGYQADGDDFVIECHHLVCDDASQGSWHGLSCQQATREILHRRWPHVSGSFDNSDNGCHYHAVMNLAHLYVVSSRAGVPVLMWSFFIPGMGKNIGDTDGSHNKQALRFYVNEGGDIEIAAHIVRALDKHRVKGAVNVEVVVGRGKLSERVKAAMQGLKGLQSVYCWSFEQQDGGAVLRRFHDCGNPVQFTASEMLKLGGAVDLAKSGTGVRLVTAAESLAAQQSTPRHATTQSKKRMLQKAKRAVKAAKRAKRAVAVALEAATDVEVLSAASVVPRQARIGSGEAI